MQFYRLTKLDEETIPAHFNKFKAIKQQLLGVKKQIPDDEATVVLLNSVDKPPYDTSVSTFQNLEKILQEVQASLLEYESKHKPTNASNSSKYLALYSQGGGAFRGSFNGQGHGRGQGTFTCNICGKPGHLPETATIKKKKQTLQRRLHQIWSQMKSYSKYVFTPYDVKLPLPPMM